MCDLFVDPTFYEFTTCQHCECATCHQIIGQMFDLHNYNIVEMFNSHSCSLVEIVIIFLVDVMLSQWMKFIQQLNAANNIPQLYWLSNFQLNWQVVAHSGYCCGVDMWHTLSIVISFLTCTFRHYYLVVAKNISQLQKKVTTLCEVFDLVCN